MNIENEAITILVQEIVKSIKMMLNKASFDKTKKGRVVSCLGEKHYEVQLDGNVYKAYSPTFTFNINDIVYVKIVENNYNNLIIECAIK